MVRALFFLAAMAGIASSVHAAVFASYVASSSPSAPNFVQGTIYTDDVGDVDTYDMANFADPTVVGDPTIGPYAGLTQLDNPPPGIISPFDPPSDSDQAVAIGYGGQLTLTLPQAIKVTSGPQIGVFTTIGIYDNSYPNGVAGTPAATFDTQSAVVSVSSDGKNWVSIGFQNFTIPENYFTNATDPYQVTPPSDPQVADFGQPFTGTLADFDGESYAQMLATLDGSAGGTWLDLSSSGLSTVQYIQFSEPVNDVDVPVTSFVAISAVSVADAPLPEPGACAILALFAAGALRRRTARCH